MTHHNTVLSTLLQGLDLGYSIAEEDMVDRLDEIFPRRSDVERTALRGLLMRFARVLHVRSARALSLVGFGGAKSIAGVAIVTAFVVGFSVAAVSRPRAVAAQAAAPACTDDTPVH